MRFALLTSVALCTFAWSTPLFAQSVKSGIDAWSRGDYPGAIAVWRPLAAKGDGDALFNLGQAYRLGRGVPIDLAQATDFYKKAAEGGHVDAQTQLGILLFQNGNQLSGLRWLRAASDKGEPRAELLYGTALFNGDGLVRRDPEAAYALVARAAQQGLAPAKTTLAEMDKAIPADVRQRALATIQNLPRVVTNAVPQPRPATPTQSRVRRSSTPAPVPGPIAANGNWRVQLGAFSQPASAIALFARLSAGPLAGRQAFYTRVGAITRLQAGPLPSRAAADRLCAAVKAAGSACLPVAP